MAPFLFVTDDQTVFLASVTLEPSEPNQPRGPAGTSVAGTLGRFLERIEVSRDPVRGVVPVVNHRYDRLVEP